MTLDKLKVAARQHEQRDEWRAAIELYRQAIHDAESGAEGGDPSVFNRIGDLEHKTGDDVAACEAWEQAATRYAEQGFFNNAIALGGKILRLDPTRVRTYLELAPPNRIVFTWAVAPEKDASTVAIDVTPTAEGCSVRLTHAMPPEYADFIDRARGSWEKMLGVLATLL